MQHSGLASSFGSLDFKRRNTMHRFLTACVCGIWTIVGAMTLVDLPVASLALSSDAVGGRLGNWKCCEKVCKKGDNDCSTLCRLVGGSCVGAVPDKQSKECVLNGTGVCTAVAQEHCNTVNTLEYCGAINTGTPGSGGNCAGMCTNFQSNCDLATTCATF